MKVILCLDNSNGMLFNGRRQSQDSLLREKVLSMASGARLFMNSYTAKQFEGEENIFVSDEFLNEAQTEDLCFVENCNIPLDRVDEFYIFRWNRDYPGDVFFEINLEEEGFKRTCKEDFVGNSHKKITLEIYRR